MTLKYESEILFDLMKRDGDDTPSDVLPYESELKEKYLQQVEGAYPKLQDYRPEWLNYNLNAHLPADFPVESVSNVTNATFENVVPYAYGSAILKGQTLGNLLTGERQDNAINKGFIDYYIGQVLKANTVYTAIFQAETEALDLRVGITQSPREWNSDAMVYKNGYNKVLLTTTVETAYSLRIRYNDEDSKVITVSNVMLIEGNYTNIDIPYFEGIQSVKMPVLTTTGKNLFDVESVFKVDGNTVKEAKDGSVVLYKPSYNSYIFETIKVKANTTYTISCEIEKIIDGGKPVYGLGGVTENKTAISDSNGDLVLFMRAGEQTKKSEVKFYNIQLEEGSTATSYEPYKSNLLTVNEEVELRGIGEVQDELNLITGELTQRIGEVVLDGIENANKYIVAVGELTNTARFRYRVSELGFPNAICKCDKMISQVGYSLDYEHVYINENDIWFFIEKTKLTANTARAVQEYLTSNPITVQFQLATEKSIKTVDLTVTDQDGNTESIIRPIEGTMHLMTEGDTIKPLFSGEIPVEATTQNLMSFTNILEEE